MNQTWEIGKKRNFGLDFGRFAQIWFHKLFFSWVLPLLHVIHCCKLSLYVISRKTNEPNLKKWGKKSSFELDFGPFSPNLGSQNIFRGFYLYY